MGVSSHLWLPWIGQWLIIQPDIHQADAIAVFGGGHRRTKEATRLYRQGLATQVWHTGWKDVDTPTDRTTAAAYEELQNTVSDDLLQVEYTNSTWEDAQVIARLAKEHNVRSILIITDSFHSRRALCSLRRSLYYNDDIIIYYSPVPLEEHEMVVGTWWEQEYSRSLLYSEYSKLGYYMLRYGVIPLGC
jgi:uncharacterized SAM-binding protein YcdF (DUF218 family)